MLFQTRDLPPLPSSLVSSSRSQVQTRAKSLAPTSRASSPSSQWSASSSPWTSERQDLLQYYSSYVGQSSRQTRSRLSQQRELESNGDSYSQRSQSSSSLHLPIWVGEGLSCKMSLHYTLQISDKLMEKLFRKRCSDHQSVPW